MPSNALIISALFSIPFALVFAIRDGLTVDFSWPTCWSRWCSGR
ncbi:hypothetical protein [Micrococcus sp. FDAARGOS_333]|nr:hypothetical protein [Micrococcus sp. FDAARGOS_333]